MSDTPPVPSTTAVPSTVFVGGGNVFADLGLPSPENLLAKAKLTARIQSLLDRQGLSDTQAAARIGVSTEPLSRLLDGHLDDFTFDQFFHILTRLGLTVEVRVTAALPEDATLTVIAASPSQGILLQRRQDPNSP